VEEKEESVIQQQDQEDQEEVDLIRLLMELEIVHQQVHHKEIQED